MDRANNVCSSPDILAKEVEHLSKVLCYNNYPNWLINRWGRSDQSGPLLHPETGNEIKKQFFYLCPLLFRSKWGLQKDLQVHTHTGCLKGVNMLKSLLMHPKDKVTMDQKKDLVYHWQYQADGCKSYCVGEMSWSQERAKEHAKSTTLAKHKHCTDFHHPLPSVTNFSIIARDPSRVTREAKEAIHIRRLDPDLNRNIGKMVIPHVLTL